MDESERYKKDSMKRVRIPYMLVLRRYGGSLAAISFTWYVLLHKPCSGLNNCQVPIRLHCVSVCISSRSSNDSHHFFQVSGQ